MLEVYKDCLSTVWKWTKELLVGLAVLLPGIIFLIYMFATNMPDVGIIQGILVIAAIIVWSPIPLRPIFYKDKTYTECYATLTAGVGMGLLACFVLCCYIIFIGLPMLIGLIVFSFLDRAGTPIEALSIIGINLLWGPGAHYFAMKILEKIFKDDKKVATHD